ncbi:MAG: TlpA family protein disulfide reductase [Flavobacteriaceae bacterium]|nr:TlpA family protein disulfide reductase [Flavobacteriaceae bacterium]
MGNESVSITGSIEDFDGDIKAIGSKYDGVRYEHEMLNRELIREAGLLEDEVMSLIQKGAPRDSIDRIYYQKEEPKGKLTIVWEKKEKQDYDFLKKKINTAYGRSMLLYISDEVTKEQLKELLSLVESQYKQTKEVQYLKARIDYDKLVEGAKYYDFNALDWDGKQVKFSSYFNKGKYVLLDFSTMYCGYCQMAAPQTAKLAEEMKDKLTYVTYYIDMNKDIMKQYYELRGNKGIILWNKEGRSHSVNAMYSQTGTPHYVLLDATGKVVTIIPGYSKDISEMLKAFIN